ncbi:MAG: creatininase family protein [Firmicutes bacterium]|nr:creatininase family protein [Bacillota bacterium]
MMMDRQPEVRYHRLRPQQIVERRSQCPVAYIPIGTIEWHGVHNPTGTDTLQAEEIAVRCAQIGGGLAFPPLWYGENRSETLMDATAADRSEIAREMGLDPDNFLPERMPFSVMDQTLNYSRLLIHILAEVESLGFRVGVLVAGHYPLVDHARAAALLFNKRARTRQDGMLAWAFSDYLLVGDLYECAGDHAGGWETSHMMAIAPETVDLGLLAPKGEPLVGCMGKMPPQDANAAFGRETLEKACERAVQEAMHRLKHRQAYLGHGTCMQEGLWRKQNEE